MICGTPGEKLLLEHVVVLRIVTGELQRDERMISLSSEFRRMRKLRADLGDVDFLRRGQSRPLWMIPR